MITTLQEALRSSVAQLFKLTHNTDQAWFEAELLLSHVLKNTRMDLIAYRERRLTKWQLARLNRLISRRVRHEPMAYLLGTQNFYGRDFFVNKHVLIPRPETEGMIDRALSIVRADARRPWLIWDVGTGSGAIATTLANELPSATVIASDVSRAALKVAKKNASRLKAPGIQFIRADLLDKKIRRLLTTARGQTHGSAPTNILIVANLPYLPLSDKKGLMPDVVKFEPPSALFTKENGLFLIHRLLRQLGSFELTACSLQLSLLIEFDPPQTSELKSLVTHLVPHANITVHKDLCGRNRILEIKTKIASSSNSSQ